MSVKLHACRRAPSTYAHADGARVRSCMRRRLARARAGARARARNPRTGTSDRATRCAGGTTLSLEDTRPRGYVTRAAMEATSQFLAGGAAGVTVLLATVRFSTAAPRASTHSNSSARPLPYPNLLVLHAAPSKGMATSQTTCGRTCLHRARGEGVWGGGGVLQPNQLRNDDNRDNSERRFQLAPASVSEFECDAFTVCSCSTGSIR